MNIQQFYNSLPKELFKGFASAITVALTAPLYDKHNNKIYRVGAALLDRKHIMFCSHNVYKTHPAFKDCKSPTLHAERVILLNIRNEILRNEVLFVARITRNNEIANARPCPDCKKLIDKSNITSVWYTDDGPISYNHYISF